MRALTLKRQTVLAARVHASDSCPHPWSGRFCQESKIGEADAVGALDGFCPTSDDTAAGAWTPPPAAESQKLSVRQWRPPRIYTFAPADRRWRRRKRERQRERRRARRDGGASGPAGRLETVQKVLTGQAPGALSCPGRCLTLQSHHMVYRCR
jgi:hypothetical protein